MSKIRTSFFLLIPLFFVSCMGNNSKKNNSTFDKDTIKHEFQVKKTDDEWKKELSPEQYRVLRQEATELAFSGKYNDHKEEGVYYCAGCGNEVFSSETKFESGTGWPSFYAPISENNIGTRIDKAFGMTRTEVHCIRCGGHLGHVFEDGPKPTGLRYCLNSAALGFLKKT